MVRYFINFSYVGTQFNGSQRQTAYGMEHPKPRISTVQDVMERSLLGINVKRNPLLLVSSRTDAGVHALSAAAHVDLEPAVPGTFFAPDALMRKMNAYFFENEHRIRVNRMFIVPETFHSRHHAKSRTYVYRVAVCHDDRPHLFRNIFKYPLFEYPRPFLDDYCYRVFPPFDTSTFVKTASLFEGTHNFTTFSKPHKVRSMKKPRDPVRNMKICNISPGQGILSDHDPWQKNIEYWDVILQSSGFLHNQVRKIVGTLIAVAQQRITEKDVKFMLDNPSYCNWIPTISQCPPHGLFLKEIEYDEKDLLLPEDYFDVITKFKCSYLFKYSQEYGRLFGNLATRIAHLSEKSETLSLMG